MVKWIALRAFETWAVARLLASPTFHRAVRSVHKKVHEAQHGKVHSEMGGLQRDGPTQNNLFLKHLKEELRDQFWGRPGSGK